MHAFDAMPSVLSVSFTIAITSSGVPVGYCGAWIRMLGNDSIDFDIQALGIPLRHRLSISFALALQSPASPLSPFESYSLAFLPPPLFSMVLPHKLLRPGTISSSASVVSSGGPHLLGYLSLSMIHHVLKHAAHHTFEPSLIWPKTLPSSVL